MKIVRSFSFVFLVLTVSVFASSADPAPRQSRASTALRNITIDDYFKIQDVSQPELSPDGLW
ncbi:MAG: hypothetical protein WCE50_04165, partial [Candidatus Acidiferrum sp.]